MDQVAIDNDILFKGACYGLLKDFAGVAPLEGCLCGVLGAARFMLPKRLNKRPPTQGAATAIRDLLDFLDAAVSMEPDAAETALAAQLEKNALALGMQLDPGESLLCALVTRRALAALVTGDKRAIEAIGAILVGEPRLRGRVYCLEQLFLMLLRKGRGSKAKESVCANPEVDKALAISFACSSTEISEADWQAGLRSYVESIRVTAAGTLAAI